MEALEAVAAPAGLAQSREAVERALRRGELLTAFDTADQALAHDPGDRWLQHRAVLALARAGSTGEARRRFVQYRLFEVDSEDVKALAARLEKDVALRASGVARRAAAARAADLYQAAFGSTGGYYSGINAATLRLVAGDVLGARALAEQVLPLARQAQADGYYAAATEAEAELLLGRVEKARAALARAGELADGDFGAVATTRRQLRLVCEESSIGSDVLSALAVPEVVHYGGHRLRTPDDPRFPSSRLAELGAEIDVLIARHRIGFAYGSLASGADILWAEALLRHGAELHVVLPFSREEFIDRSVAPAGSGWVARFGSCVERATSVRYATEDSYLGDDVLFGYASELAMGLALLRAEHIDAGVMQFAIWDGNPSTEVAGTAADVEKWGRAGRRAHVLPLGEVGVRSSPGAGDVEETPSGRVVRAILFADIRGFSKLHDAQLPSFCRYVLGAFGDVLRAHHHAILYRERPGDGLYLVLTDAEAAAQVALDLQHAVDAIDKPAVGLPEFLSLRVGAHLGPVLPFVDPVLGLPSFTGSHVSRTARIEPVTPPGEIFVTEQFAASVLVLAHNRYACDYVGHMPAAKDYGRLRMYRLRVAEVTDG